MWVLKKHIGAFKGNKTDTAEGVCQQVMAEIRCIYFLRV